MFKFENESWLALLAVIPLAMLSWWLFDKWRQQAIRQLGNPTTIESLLQHFSIKRWHRRFAMLGMAYVLLVLALANPQGEGKRQKIKQKSADIYIALDISNSMLATDLPPNRLERAKLFAQKLIQALATHRIGLIFFAGNAYMQMPLTTDAQAAFSLLKSANTDWVSEQGTAIGQVYDLVMKNTDPKIPVGKALVIITDGESHDDDALSAAQTARKKGITTFMVGVGSAKGAPIPIGLSGFKRDENGEIVLTRLNPKLIRDLARAGGGDAFFLESAEAKTVAALHESLQRLEKRELEVRSVREFETYYQWLVLPALLLLLFEIMPFSSFSFIKKWTAGSIILGGLVFARPVAAQSVLDLKTRGDRAYQNNDMRLAEEYYRRSLDASPLHPPSLFNLGNSIYHQRRFQQAAEYFEQAAQLADTPERRADAFFNAGNAYFKSGQYHQAFEAYKNSLKNRPNDAQTLQNLELARRRLQQQQQQQQQQQNQPQKEQPPQQQNQLQQQQQNNQQQQQQNQNKSNKQSDETQRHPPQKPENQQDTQQQTDREQALHLLRTLIEREDRENGKKYRQQTQNQRKPEKDW